jgi:hypothetical protein
MTILPISINGPVAHAGKPGHQPAMVPGQKGIDFLGGQPTRDCQLESPAAGLDAQCHAGGARILANGERQLTAIDSDAVRPLGGDL